MNPSFGCNLVVCAVRWETLFLGTSVPIVSLGIGAQRSGQNLEKAIRRYSPRRVVLAGFSGGVRSDQRVGDIALPAIFCSEPEGRELIISAAADLRARMTEFRLLDQTRQISIAHIANAQKKSDIGRRWPDACGVDMESFSLASLCAERGIAFTCVRAIFDEVDQRLPSWNNLWRLPLWYLQAASVLAKAIRCCLT